MRMNVLLALYGLFLMRISFIGLNSEAKRDGYPSLLEVFKDDKKWKLYQLYSWIGEFIIIFSYIFFLILSMKTEFQHPALIKFAMFFIVYEAFLFSYRCYIIARSNSIEEHVRGVLKLDETVKWIEAVEIITILALVMKPIIESVK